MKAVVYGGIGGLFSVVVCLLLANALTRVSGGAELVMMAVVFALPGIIIGCTWAVLEEFRAVRDETAIEKEKEPTIIE